MHLCRHDFGPSTGHPEVYDLMIAPESETMMPGRLGAKKVITLDSSHASLASRPDEVSSLIDEAVNATQG